MALVVTCLAFGVRAGRVALCVTGAVRTFVEPQVYESLARFASPRGDVDVHYHLFVGRELSYRGQARRVTAAALTPAVANAVSLRLALVGLQATSRNPIRLLHRSWYGPRCSIRIRSIH